MNIYKIDNNHYRIRQSVNGKSYSVSINHRPSQREAQRLINEKIEEQSKVLYDGVPESFRAFAGQYIESVEKKLSPSTIRGYKSIWRNVPDRFGRMYVSDIKERDIQQVVDLYSETHSPKSTRLFFGFICSVLKWKRPKLKIEVELPKPERKFEYEPTTEDIKKILRASVGTEYEVILRLCVLGMRRGEVCALTLSDLSEDNVLTINKDMVIDNDGKLIIKDKPKTEDSNRRIAIPAELGDLIRKQGYVYKYYPNSVSKYLQRTQDALGIPRFRLHMLRHFAAAYLHSKGMTDSQILAYGGWSESSDTMKRVYRYNLDPAESQKKIANLFSDLSSDLTSGE